MIEKTIQDATPELMQRIDAAVVRFVPKAAGYIEGQLKSSMAEPKSGRSYPRGKDAVHIASAPGESPAVDSNNLTGSIQQIFPSPLEARTGTPVEYAVYLEEGTDDIDPRPLWEVTVDNSLPALQRMLEAEIGQA